VTAAKIVDHERMVGLRWVGWWALLALSCGRTANTDGTAVSGGSPSAMAGSGSAVGGSGSAVGATASGGAPGSSEAAGAAGAPVCPVTPVTGQWFARGPDPYGFEFTSDGTQLSGTGCLGELPSEGRAFACSPLSLLADKGRSVDFVWDMHAVAFGYGVKMELTLSPDRTAMAGTMWGSAAGFEGEQGRDIVLVRYPADQPLPAATSCSDGEPSGACFLAPLRSDYVDQVRVVELGSGNLLLVWLNQRGVGRRLASARFDAATGSWQEAEFLDDGMAPVDPASLRLTTAPDGRTVVAYLQGNAITARVYDRDANAWSERQVVAKSADASVNLRPVALFVYEGGDATLVASAEGAGPVALSVYDYASATRAWEKPRLIDDAAKLVPYGWAAASDTAGNAVVVMVHGAAIGEPNELWFSRRGSAGSWTAPAPFHSVAGQLLRPAVAVGKDGTAVATWQEFAVGVVSSVYSLQTGSWSEPLTVTSAPDTENRAVAFDDAGAPVASFHCNVCVSEADQKSTFTNGAWGAPQTATAADALGQTYAATFAADDIEVAPVEPRPGESPLPPLPRPRCEGY
jgi:hypothetical protein